MGFCLFITPFHVDPDTVWEQALKLHQNCLHSEGPAVSLQFQISNTEALTELWEQSIWKSLKYLLSYQELHFKSYISEILLQCQVILPSLCFFPPPCRDHKRKVPLHPGNPEHRGQITVRWGQKTFPNSSTSTWLVFGGPAGRCGAAAHASSASQTSVNATSQPHELPLLPAPHSTRLSGFGGSLASGHRLP